MDNGSLKIKLIRYLVKVHRLRGNRSLSKILVWIKGIGMMGRNSLGPGVIRYAD